MAKKKAADSLSEELVTKVMREMGRKGGKARVPKGFAKKQLPKRQRVAAAKKAAAARWTKRGV
jgi:hypothetical protein